MSPFDTTSDSSYSTYNNNSDCLYYSLLNVNRSASTSEIQKSYKFLSRSFHPDKQQQQQRQQQSNDDNNNDGAALQQVAQASFLAIKAAHDVLVDPILRLAYDVGGRRAVRLIKRSQQHHAAASARRKCSSSHRQQQQEQDDSEQDDGEDERGGILQKVDLYAAMQRALTREDAIFILQEAFEEYLLQREASSYYNGGGSSHLFDDDEDEEEADGTKQTRSSSTSLRTLTRLNASMEIPYTVLYPFQRERANLTVQLQRPLYKSTTSSCTVTCSASSRVSHLGQADVSTSVSCEYQPNVGTLYAIDARIPVTNRPSINSNNNNKNGSSKGQASIVRMPLFLVQQLSLRTTRHLSSRTAVVLAWAGKPNDLSTWNYSIASHRNLNAETLFGATTQKQHQSRNKQQQPRHLQALWKLGLAQMHVAFAMASIKNLSFPQWTVRLNPLGGGSSGGPSFPLKIRYQAASNRGLLVTCSFGGLMSFTTNYRPQYARYKVCWISSFWSSSSARCWSIQYGIKFDGRGQIMNVSSLPVWTLLCHLRSPDWSLRVPIYLSSCNVALSASSGYGPVSWMICILVGQWLDQWMDKWNAADKKKRKKSAVHDANTKNDTLTFFGALRGWIHDNYWGDVDKDDTIPVFLSHCLFNSHPSWRDNVRHIAAKKRQQEECRENGLVILQATLLFCHGVNESQDVTELLQFWVVNGRLELSLNELFCRFGVESRATNENETTHFMNRLFWWWDNKEGPQHVPRTETSTLTVRYQHHGYVYELFISSSTQWDTHNLLVLPNNDLAMQLGPSSHVS